MKLLIIAMETEASEIIKSQKMKLIKGIFPSYQNDEFILIISGIGKVNAASATSYGVLTHHPSLIINLGFVGAKGFETGEVVVVETASYHDVDLQVFGYELGQIPKQPAKFLVPSNLMEKNELPKGHLYTGDKFMTSISNLSDKFLVDMEGAAIFHTASLLNVPFISFKVVSDQIGVSSQLPDYKAFESDVGAKLLARFLEERKWQK